MVSGFLHALVIQIGCPGTTVTVSSFLPKETVEFYEAAVKRDYDKAWELANKFDLFHRLRREAAHEKGGPIYIHCTKVAMAPLGMPSGLVKPVLYYPLPNEEIRKMRKYLADLGLLEE